MKFKDVLFLFRKALKIENWHFLNTKNKNAKKEVAKSIHYRLVIINDVTLREAFAAPLTRKKVYIFISIFFVVNLFFWALIFSHTPLRILLPEEKHNAEKEKLIELKKKVDSLEKIYELNDKLIQQYKGYFITQDNNKSKK